MADVIAFCGPQRAGKSLAAESLAAHHGYQVMSFADPLYSMLAALIGISIPRVRRLDKNVGLEALEGHTLRHALQTLGTEWGRTHIGRDVWSNNMLRRIQEARSMNRKVVIDDCRFKNEYGLLSNHGVSFVLIQRPDGEATVNPTHGSEVEWPAFKTHAEVVNDVGSGSAWVNLAADRVLEALGSKGKS